MQHELEPVCLQLQAEFPHLSEGFIRRIVGQIMAGCGGRIEDVRYRLTKRWDNGFWYRVEREVHAQRNAEHEALINLTPIHFVGEPPTSRRRAAIRKSVRSQLQKHYLYALRAGQAVQVTVFNSGNWNMELVERLHSIGSLQKQYRLMTLDEQAWPAFVERNFTYKKVKPLHIGHSFVALTPKGLMNYAEYDQTVFDAWLEEQS